MNEELIEQCMCSCHSCSIVDALDKVHVVLIKIPVVGERLGYTLYE